MVNNFDFKENEDGTGFIATYTQKLYTNIVNTKDEELMKRLREYAKDNYVELNIIDEEIANEIIRLGIAEYTKKEIIRGSNE